MGINYIPDDLTIRVHILLHNVSLCKIYHGCFNILPSYLREREREREREEEREPCGQTETERCFGYYFWNFVEVTFELDSKPIILINVYAYHIM